MSTPPLPTLSLHTRLLMCLTAMLALTDPAFAAQPVFTRWQEAQPILQALAEGVPADVTNADETKWDVWIRQEDRKIRARLEQGDIDSAVNLLLFGTSFTRHPRIRLEDIADASRSGLLRARLLDLLQGLRAAGTNERLIFLRDLFRAREMDPENAEGYRKLGIYILENLERVLAELRTFAGRAADARQAGNRSAEFEERSRLFRDRGVSLDTSLLPAFGIEEALRDLKGRGLLREGAVARAAVIGPGLDFADWDSGYDYYPQQTVQPFALYDSLKRLALGAQTRITVLDISPRVLEHLRRARQQASKGASYRVQLPYDPSREWREATLGYWRVFGDQIGQEVSPLRPPATLALKTRAISIRAATLAACEPVDVNIVLQHLDLPESARFDLVVATNVFVYYDVLEQALALQNVAAMLRPGGILLVNSKLPELDGTGMNLVGITKIQYAADPKLADAMLWYQRVPVPR